MVNQRKYVIGVMGTSHGDIPDGQLQVARVVGRSIAQNGMVVLTGGCRGVPEAAAMGAREEGGIVIGISPARHIKEHMGQYQQSSEIDLFVYTGAGDAGRIPINIMSSDAIIVVGGGYGTLAEVACACVEKKIIAHIMGIGGVSSALPDIVKALGVTPKGLLISGENGCDVVEEIKKTLDLRHPNYL